MSKRLAPFFAGHSGSSKRVKAPEAVKAVGDAPSPAWNVVLEGEFTVHERTSLESTLEECGVTLSCLISDNTTHLILGTVSGVDANGEPTGVGSKAHWEAQEEHDIKIVKEKQIWERLNDTEPPMLVSPLVVNRTRANPMPPALKEGETNVRVIQNASDVPVGPIASTAIRPPFGFCALPILAPQDLNDNHNETNVHVVANVPDILTRPIAPKAIQSLFRFRKPPITPQGLTGIEANARVISKVPDAPNEPSVPEVTQSALGYRRRSNPTPQSSNKNETNARMAFNFPGIPAGLAVPTAIPPPLPFGVPPIYTLQGLNKNGTNARVIPEVAEISTGPIVPAVIRPPFGFGSRSIPTPEVGTWRGLKETERKYSTGRAKCGGCGNRISSGVMMVHMMEDSLFRQLMGHRGSGGTEAGRRGYIEVTIPPLGVNSIGKRRFWIHEWCDKKATNKFKKRFEEEWEVIRGMILAGTLAIQY